MAKKNKKEKVRERIYKVKPPWNILLYSGMEMLDSKM